MAEPLTGGTVAVDYQKTADASFLMRQSGDKVKELLDKVKSNYMKNVNSPDVWQSKAAENAYRKFEVLQNKFTALHEKILSYSAGVKLVSDSYKAFESSRIKKGDEVLNSESI